MNAWTDQIADALDYMEWIGSVASDWPSIEENVGLLADAARLVLDARPLDQEAVAREAKKHGLRTWRADRIVAAALRVDPGSKVRVLVIEEER